MAKRKSKETDAAARQVVEAAAALPRIVIDRLSPCVDGGRYPAKGVVGQPVEVGATIFMDGHDRLAAQLLWCDPLNRWHAVPMTALENDRWQAVFTPERAGLHLFAIEAWLDRWASFCSDLDKKYRAGVAVALELREGRLLLEDAAANARPKAAAALRRLAKRLEGAADPEALALLQDAATAALVHSVGNHPFLVRSEPAIAIDVERSAAGFGAWYELFPRSQSREPGRHGTFDDVIARLPAIHAMGFDVLYLPPIHPIGRIHRKGPNNSLVAGPIDPGSPYAIGAAEGGHDAVLPELGGLEGLRRLRSAAQEYGIELALDFAIQCAPDHPWLSQHPEWFSWRPDGSLRYAENPPKKYEDIVPVDFYNARSQPELWLALRDVVRFWIDQGVKIFRVDNPHTKPLPFWQWLLASVRAEHPDTIFLSEAFTRPAMMYHLAKIGFSQSYTYFIWRNSRAELADYLTELAEGPPRDFFRPHFFVNTPDINPYFLQSSGRPGFLIRAALAALLSGLWGMYSGFELCESAPLPGKEEYLDSEKYQLRHRDWNAPGNIGSTIARLNHIRRDHPALHTHLGVRFHDAGNDRVLFFSKRVPGGDEAILAAVSLDPVHGQHAQLQLPLERFGLDDGGSLLVEELMRGLHFHWHGRAQHWYFDPGELPFAVWRVRPTPAAARGVT